MKKLFAIALIVCLTVLALASCGSGEPREYAVNDYRTTMEFHDDFKILQLTDLHFGIESDLALQLGIVKKAISEADPDLIILTGDNFMYSNKSIVERLIGTLNEECKRLTASHPDRLTKFAITFGNHDNQGDYPRYFVPETVKAFATEDGREIEDGKYAAFIDYEDDNIFGFTNYFIDLVDDRSKSLAEQDVKYRLHIIDSNTYHYVGPKYKYDVIHEDQLAHVGNIYASATPDKDYIGMAFFHIPFAEYQEAKEQYESAEHPELIGQGVYLEDAFSPYTNNGAFEAVRAANIISFSVGHDHINCADVIYNAQDDSIDNKAILSFGVKSTNQLYHSEDMIGYKVINLEDGMTKEAFLTIENVNRNYINVREGNEYYE